MQIFFKTPSKLTHRASKEAGGETLVFALSASRALWRNIHLHISET